MNTPQGLYNRLREYGNVENEATREDVEYATELGITNVVWFCREAREHLAIWMHGVQMGQQININ